MADEVLKIDKNHRNVLGGVTDDANLFLTNLRVDPSTLRLKVDAAITSGGSGGTQYANGAAQATPTGTVALGWDGANVQALKTTTGGILNVVGSVAHAAADSGNPVKVGGKYNSTTPTLTDGQRGDVQLSSRATLLITPFTLNNGSPVDFYADNADGVAVTTNQASQPVIARNSVFNGTTWDRMPGTTSGVKVIAQTQTDTVMIGGVNIKEINAVTPLMGNGATGTGSLRVTMANDTTGIANWGHGATGSAVPTGAQYHGAQARSSEITAATNANLVGLVADLVGKLIVLPYANPENFVNGTTAAIVDTTTTSVIATQGAGVRTYITQITVTNSHATVGTFVKITDGASTILHEGYAAAAGGGYTASFPTPLKGTANTAVNAICVTTGANVIASVSGYKGV